MTGANPQDLSPRANPQGSSPALALEATGLAAGYGGRQLRKVACGAVGGGHLKPSRSTVSLTG